MDNAYEIFSASSISHMRKNAMGRKKMWAEDMVARFVEGTFKRLDAVRKEGEDRTDFVREAVERELKRRERRERAEAPVAGNDARGAPPGRAERQRRLAGRLEPPGRPPAPPCP